MGELKSFLTPRHQSASRNYQERATEKKPELAKKAKLFAKDYWDGGRDTGYGGYIDDGRWSSLAARILDEYQVGADGSVLDVGCGKGFFLNEVKKRNPQINVKGIDVSSYAIQQAPELVRPYLSQGRAEKLDEQVASYDLVVSMNVLHNLELPELMTALASIQRASRKSAYICVESYRNEQEKWNLLRWQLTCESFFTPREWQWVFEASGYRGDYELIFFE